MNEFLSFLYTDYIKPYLDRQPRDDGDTFRFSLCEGNQTQETQRDVDAVVAFAAAHAFLKILVWNSEEMGPPLADGNQ